MRDDFRNFLSTHGVAGRNFGPTPDTQSDLARQSSFSNRLLKNSMTPGKLKPLFDSSYIPPLKNPSVIQDNDPVKQHAINEAIKRYQQEIERKNKTDERLLVKHYDRVKHDED